MKKQRKNRSASGEGWLAERDALYDSQRNLTGNHPCPTRTTTSPASRRTPSDIRPVSILDEMKRSYLDYAMSVIVARALPDARDGLKPVHRRILFAMNENGFEWNKPTASRRERVGDVIGKYHPHGDQSVYDALVRMAQDFSMRVPLIDGQGNFGSVDGDPPAAMRYTESRLTKIAQSLLEDIDKDTVDYQAELRRLRSASRGPAGKFPNLLVNGARRHRRRHGDQHPAAQSRRGDRRLHRADRRSRAVDRRPDEDRAGSGFPDGRLILGRQGIRSAYHWAAARSSCAARSMIETMRKDREAIIVPRSRIR